MNNNNIIKFSRDSIIETSYDVAIIKLNEYPHVSGQPVLVRYYDKHGKVCSILAVGILDGPGKSNYTIVSNGAIEPVTGVYDTRLPDVSVLVNDEVYVCYDADDEPAYCFLEGSNKSYTKITEDRTFYSALDGFFWFVSGGIIRRSDSPIDSRVLTSIIQGLIDDKSLVINNEKKIYTWSDRPDGVVSEPYARVFNIPSGASVVMAVFTNGPFGKNFGDIITYSTGSSTAIYNLTTKISDFKAGKKSWQDMGVVKRSTSQTEMYPTSYKFIVLASTCKEEDITWFSGSGFSGTVNDFTCLGGDNSTDNYVTIDCLSNGKVTANLSETSGFIINAKNCEGKTVNLSLADVPTTDNSYKFVINSDIPGLKVTANGGEIVNIDQELYSGTIVTLTKSGDEWIYTTSGSDIISSDGSINIVTSASGQKDLTVGTGTKEFAWLKSCGLSTFTSSGTSQNSWIQVLNFTPGDTITDQLNSTTIEFKCKELGISGFINMDLSTGRLYCGTGHEFYKAISSKFDFAVSVSGEYCLYIRPKSTLYSFEVKLISCGLKWKYSSENHSAKNPNPYVIKNSYVSPSTIIQTTTDKVEEGSDKLITSGGVYSKIEELRGTGEGLEELEERIERIEESYVKTVTASGQTFEPTDGDINLGNIYTSSTTTILNSDTVIKGIIAKRGSLVTVNESGDYESIVALSSESVFYKFTANTLGWWNIGTINRLGGVRVTVSADNLTTVVGNIWWNKDKTPVTDNETLAGYIKSVGNTLYVRGSSVNPFTVEVEDFQTCFSYSGLLSGSVDCKTIGVFRYDSNNYTILSDSTKSSINLTSVPGNYVITNGINPELTIDLPTKKCFTFDIVFKNSLSKSIEVNTTSAGDTKTLNLTGITVSPGVIYTITYKIDEIIYTVKTDSNLPLSVSDLGVVVESIGNKTTSVNNSSTDDQYPTAKAVWNAINGKITSDLQKASKYDSTYQYQYQGAIKTTTPAIINVYWTTSGGTFSDTLYVNGKKGQSSTYNIRCHNYLDVFSLRYYNGEFYVCIPAKKTSSDETVTYNFSPTTIGTCSLVEDNKFFNSSVSSIYVGQSVDTIVGGKVYNIDNNTTITDFSFQDYGTILATTDSTGTIKIEGTDTLPAEDKIYSFINNTGHDVGTLTIEGKNSAGRTSKLTIKNIQEGAVATIAYVAETNTFSYTISLQAFISPKKTISIEKTEGADQWKFDVSDDLLEKINNPVEVAANYEEGTKIATVNNIDIYVPASASNETVTITPTETIGGVKAGEELTNKTAIEILKQMLTPYKNPSIRLTVSQSTMLYGKSYDNVMLTADGTEGSEEVKSMTVNGNTYTDLSSMTKKLNLGTISANDNSKQRLTYDASIVDINGKSATTSATIQFTGGIFMFYSIDEDIAAGTRLDFTTHNCQPETTAIKGFYENVTHENEEYLYIIAPNTSSMEIKTISSSGYGVPMNLLGIKTLKQGTGETFVSVEMRIYRSADKHKPGTFSCEINNPSV